MLDINALEPDLARAFGDGQVLREWFSTLLQYSNVTSLAGPYSVFGAIAGAALDMVAEARGTRLAPDGAAYVGLDRAAVPRDGAR